MKLHRSILFIIIFPPLLCLLAQCTWYPATDPPSEPAADDGFTISLNIPGIHPPSARSMAGAAGEAVVERVDLLIFEESLSDPLSQTLAQHIPDGQIVRFPDPEDPQRLRLKAHITENPKARTIVVLANLPAGHIAEIAAPGVSKHEMMSKLRYETENTSGISDGWKWKTNAAEVSNPNPGTDFDPIPMYGERKLTAGVSAGMNIADVGMIRMLARIDVLNSAETDFTLSQVYVVNYHTAGFVAPAWNAADGTLLPSLPDNPMIPAGAESRKGEAQRLTYDYPNSGESALSGDIYLYESPRAAGAPTDESRIDACCLIVKGTLTEDGREYYYRIDFTDPRDTAGKWPGEEGHIPPAPENVDYLPVYRNHLYRFSITAVDGIGCASFDEALQSMGVSSNLKTSLLVIDESGIKHIVWDNHYYLGVGDPVLVDAAGGEARIKVATNYPSGWQIDTGKGANGIQYDELSSGWISSAVAAGNYLVVTLGQNTEAQNRQALIHLLAGRLRNRGTVEQESKSATAAPDANCYLLTPGEEVLISVARANRAVPGSIPSGAQLSAGLVWTDNPLGVDPGSNIRLIEAQGTGDEGHLRVVAGNGEGNAVVSVSVDGVIKWSWHIWVTRDKEIIEAGHPQNPEWMDRNLGAMSNAFGGWQSKETYGVYYQWGRKDAFPTTNTDIYDADGNHISWKQLPTVSNLSESIARPMEWTNNSSNWQGSAGVASWDNEGKTLFDPCPAGWRVPVSVRYAGLTTTNFIYANYGRTNNSIGGYYPMASSRQANNGYSFLDAPTQWGAGTARYWTATQSSSSQGSYLKFEQYNVGGIVPDQKPAGFVVRCVREE